MRPGRVVLAAIILAGALLGLGACASQSGDGVVSTPPCGETKHAGMLYSQRSAAVDEGNGQVGLMYSGGTDEINYSEPYGYYRLFSCRSGRAVGFDAYGIENPPAGVSLIGMEEFVANARRDGLMTTPDKLVRSALKRPGFKPVGYGWNADAMADYATCACQHFYPDSLVTTRREAQK